MTKDDDNFLSRWSRRKHEAAKPAATPVSSVPSGESREVPSQHKRNVATPTTDDLAEAHEPLIDLSKLPSLDSIGPTTDIRPFLQPGVPGSLSRAALRRMWSADPAIRDYIGPSENAWDFTAPDSMPGFGPLLPTDDVKRLLAQVFGEDKPDGSTVQVNVASSNPTTDQGRDMPPQRLDDAEPAANEIKSAEIAEPERELLHRNETDPATQKSRADNSPETAPIRRRHGGALPS